MAEEQTSAMVSFWDKTNLPVSARKSRNYRIVTSESVSSVIYTPYWLLSWWAKIVTVVWITVMVTIKYNISGQGGKRVNRGDELGEEAMVTEVTWFTCRNHGAEACFQPLDRRQIMIYCGTSSCIQAPKINTPTIITLVTFNPHTIT